MLIGFTVIAIPDVEEHIRSELLCAPNPSAHHVPIPAGHGHSRRTDRANDRVRIISSQPLPSPNPNRSPLSQSPADRIALKMATLRTHDPRASASPNTSGANSTSTSFGAVSMSTAPTSLRSDTHKLSSHSQASLTEALNSSTLASGSPGNRFSVPKPVIGPSLLSQTAPRKLSMIPSIEQVSVPSTTSATPEGTSNLGSHQDGMFMSPPHLAELPQFVGGSDIRIKIADLGNASPSKAHFTEDIQTRQYRAPEAILGRNDWDARTDIWSIGCLVRLVVVSITGT
jgi:serine/threonine-protein kinase SRPK3